MTDMLDVAVALAVALAVVACGAFAFALNGHIGEEGPTKPDGIVYFSGGQTHMGHENAAGICREMPDVCEEIFLGCGAVNCRCPNLSSDDVSDFFESHDCAFVMGEGIVCR